MNDREAQGKGRTRPGAWLLLLSLFAALLGGVPAQATGPGWFEIAGERLHPGLTPPQRLIESSAADAADPFGGDPPAAVAALPHSPGGGSAAAAVQPVASAVALLLRAPGGNRARAPPLR